MPFDPRLINPDDAPEDARGEIDLPDDLQELAAQLHDDALYLAARYPAKVAREPLPAEVYVRNDEPPAPAPTRRRWLLIGGGMAAALAITVALAYLPQSAPRAVALPATPTTATEVSLASTPSPRAEVPVSTPVRNSVGPRIERLPWAPTPAMGEVTGPELEGLLDLWQKDEHPAETRISI